MNRTQILDNNRVVLLFDNPQCELCKAPGKHIHHKDFKRVNHTLSNLMVLCPACHSYIHSKYKIRFKKAMLKYGLSYSAIETRVRKGIPLNFPKNMCYNRLKHKYKLVFK